MSTLVICPVFSMVDIISMLKMKECLISCAKVDGDEWMVQQMAQEFDMCWNVYNNNFS